MVADALSQKPVSLNTMMESLPPELQEEITQLNLVIIDTGLAIMMEVTPTLEDEIRKAQPNDPVLEKHARRMLAGQTSDFSKDQQGTLRFHGRICVPRQEDLRKRILS